MIKVITYGTYDLLHQGHINLLRRAKELGDYLIVWVTSDSFDRGRGKLNVRNNVLERVEAVKATGYADEVTIEGMNPSPMGKILLELQVAEHANAMRTELGNLALLQNLNNGESASLSIH